MSHAADQPAGRGASRARANPADEGRSPLIGTLAVIGVGLIGGSFAAALRQASAVGRVLGVGRNADSLAQAESLGLIDSIATPEEAAAQADFILIATPISAVAPMLSRMKPVLRAEAVITDACSTKADVASAARDTLGERAVQFVPGHPIAGAELTGPGAADANLYRGRNVILTPLAQSGGAACGLVRRAWGLCGARVITMDADAHDRVLASVSHVPHFLSSVYMGQVAAAADADTRLALAGSGFRDFTRIAAGSAEVWRDIFLSNRKAVLAELRSVRATLDYAEQVLQASDEAALEAFLERAALARRLWASRSGQS
ncbi:prephenate dehydrogenase/arogenate dehydrogenase family protein [Allopusillimonas soli]|uniref:Prephenate dehydrogenase/arogenate dehydrogenase family protein n=1 Tax=Allopusillimonas soli TaxID=659016 RepID=A0A853F6Z1_9BURK|nr:prephenate dehydrogenase/arogenate dehydrogenase family protein [Allopusillimonas soli]NYT35302.1 prephenate dehydrogenase/arogenate dehydrogenase family protein [Allopusillimonas soli]TEA75725.1 prephenate dehydrogenase/arogenate dehydrogenase family protein [Allopusillimonas soli]